MWPFKRKLTPDSNPIAGAWGFLKSEYFDSFSELIKSKTRYNARVRIANRWGGKHPKLILLGFVLTLSSVAAADLIVTATVRKAIDLDLQSPILGVTKFSYLSAYEQKKEYEERLKEQYRDFVMLSNRLDSLKAIPHKTPFDSIEIARVSRKILNYDKPS